MSTCIVCGKDFPSVREAKFCGTKCWRAHRREHPGLCDCGRQAVKYQGSNALCQRCIDIDASVDAARAAAAARRARLMHEPLESLGWKRFADKWIADERQRQAVRHRFNHYSQPLAP